MTSQEKAEHLVRNHPTNASLMELGRDCRFKDSVGTHGTITMITDFVNKELPYDIHFLMDDNGHEIELAASEWFEKEMTILGKPAHLEHYLKMLPDNTSLQNDRDVVRVFNDHGKQVMVFQSGKPATEKDALEFIKLIEDV